VLEFRYRTNLPKVSIILPTYNDAQRLSTTLTSLLSQRYPDFEVIIVDAGSCDRTLEVVDSFRSERIRIFSAAVFDRDKMWNQGASLARGEYLAFLYPGASYLWVFTLAYMMNMAEQHHAPDLLYCGSLLRMDGKDPQALCRPLDREWLQKGLQPSSLAACWFKRSVFGELKGFQVRASVRGGYDLLCRLVLADKYRYVSTSRVLLDHERRVLTQSGILRHFWETLCAVKRHFGWRKAALWLLHQKDLLRLLKLWLGSLRAAVLGR
jgi:glycosyltransferase involved in cell wall biosynthesis